MAFNFPQLLFLTLGTVTLTFTAATSAYAEESTTSAEEPTETSIEQSEPARTEEDPAPEDSSSETTTSEPEPEPEEQTSEEPEEEPEEEPATESEEEESEPALKEEEEPEELEAPTVIETAGGDDSSYEVPTNGPVNFYGVEYEKLYATTNAVFTFGHPDGTFWDYPETPSISMASQDWTAYSQREDESFVISHTDSVFQVDMSVRPYASDPSTTSVSRIILAGSINEDRTIDFSYYTENVDQYENLRYGVRTPEGDIETLEEANFQESEEAPEESGEILPPAPEPEPESEPEPEPEEPEEEEEVVEPEPEPEPTPQPPVVSPQPEPTPPPSVVVPPQPIPEPTPEPEPEPEEPEEEAPEPAPEVEEETPAESEVDEEEQPEEQPEPEPTPEPTTPEPTPDPEVSPSEPESDESPEPTEEPVDDEPAPVVPDDIEPEPEPTPEAEQEELIENISQDNVIEFVEKLVQIEDPKQITPEQQAVIKEAVNIVFQSSEPDSPEYEAALTALAVVAKADDPKVDENIAAIPVLGSVAAATLETFNEIGNVGADINPEVREDAQKVVVASVIVSQVAQIAQVASQAAAVTSGAAPGFAAYRRFKK